MISKCIFFFIYLIAQYKQTNKFMILNFVNDALHRRSAEYQTNFMRIPLTNFLLLDFISFYVLRTTNTIECIKLRQTDPSHSYTYTLASVRNRTSSSSFHFSSFSFYQFSISKIDGHTFGRGGQLIKNTKQIKSIRIDFSCVIYIFVCNITSIDCV